MFYPALWTYQTLVKVVAWFSPFQLVHGVEAVLLIECEIPLLKITINLLSYTSKLEEHLIHLEHLDKQR
jgi:hypothetical protein